MYHTIIIVGNLGKDPEMRYTPSGQAVTNFSVATSRKYTGSDGALVQETIWFRVSVWGKQAETTNQYLRKGSKVYIEGRLQTRKWEDSDGNTRFTTEIIAREMKMLGGGDRPENIPAPPEEGQDPPLSDDVPF